MRVGNVGPDGKPRAGQQVNAVEAAGSDHRPGQRIVAGVNRRDCDAGIELAGRLGAQEARC